MKLALCLLALATTCWSQQMKQSGPESTSAQAQATLPNAPQPQTSSDDGRFLNQRNVATFAASATAIGAEASMSCSQQTAGITLPTGTCKEIYIGAGVTMAAEVLASAALHKYNHHAIEKVAPLCGIAFHVGRMAWIATHRK